MCKYKLKSDSSAGEYFCLYYRVTDVEPCPPQCFHCTQDPIGDLDEAAHKHELRCVYLTVSMEGGSRVFTCAVDGTEAPDCRTCPPGKMEIAPTLEEFFGLKDLKDT